MKLLDRTISELERRLVILAPPGAELPESLQNVVAAPHRHTRLLHEVQRLRGAAYLEDGAITSDQLTSQGLHETPQDHRAWHVLSVGPDGGVTACAWYLQHEIDVDFDELRVPSCSLAHLPGWRERLSKAVEFKRRLARREGLRLAEVGGWAVSRHNRCTSEGPLVALGAFSLANVLGGSIAFTTATIRHSSSVILRRLGGASFRTDDENGEVPPYFDSAYRCLMELLWFDSRRPHARYRPLVQMLEAKMALVPTVISTTLPFMTELASSAPRFAA